MPLEQTAGEKPPIDEKSPIYTPPEKAKSRSFCAELSSSITVEPAAFLYFIGLITASTTTEQYAFYRLSNKHNELENHELQNHQLLKKCMPSYNKTASIVADEVATETAQFLVFFNLVNQVPPVFVALLMGSYTDRMGRKVALVAPVIGGGLRAILTLIIIYLDLSMKYLYLAAAVEGLSGGSATFTMALFAYVADISTKERRSIRIFMVQLVNTLGMAMAQITIGYMIFYWSFSYPYGLILCIYVMCLGLICMLRESVADTRPTPLLTCQHIERTVRLFVPPVGDPAVCTLRLCLLLILLDSMVEAGGLNALLLFLLSWPACFSSILLGFYLALLWSLTSLGSLMVLKALFFRMGDTGLILLGCAAGILMRLWLTLPIYDTTYIFLCKYQYSVPLRMIKSGIAGTIILVRTHSCQVTTTHLNIRKWNLRVPDFQMKLNHYAKGQGVPVTANRDPF